MNGQNDKLMGLIPLGLFFGIFFGFFVYVPPILDRWMEGVAYFDIGSVWQYLYTCYAWVRIANGRFLSNIFSVIVDRNIYLRAFCDAGMMCLIAVLVIKICNILKMYQKLIIYALFFLVSWYIQSEVYFYAATLYVSSILLLFLFFYLLFKGYEDGFVKNRSLYIVTFIACIWIENVSLVVFSVSLVMLFASTIQNKKLCKPILYNFFFAGLGFLFLLLVARHAPQGRLKGQINVQIVWSQVLGLIYDNIFIVSVIAMLCFIILWNERKNGISSKLCALQCGWWGCVLLGSMVCLLGKLYREIIAQPRQEYVKGVYGWIELKIETFEKVLDLGRVYIYYVLPFIIGICALSCIYIILKSNNVIKGICILVMMVSGSLLSIMGLVESGARMSLHTVFASILFIGFLLNQCNVEIATEHLKIICIIVCLAALLNIEQACIVLENNRRVADQRWETAELVKERQYLGEWDYSKYVVMPKYFVGQRSLVGGNMLQPQETDVHYPLLLKYYGLDENTKIRFE